MKLLKLYEEILKTGLMTVNEEGLVQQPDKFSSDGTVVVDPTVIDGKRLVLPTKEHIDYPDKDSKIVFHPLSENVLAGESVVLSKLKNMCSLAVNMSLFNIIRGFITLALSVEEHKRLSPTQSEVLSILKDVDEKTEKDMIRMILNAAKKEGMDGLFFRVYLKRGGTIIGRKFARVGVVSFPFYEELEQDKKSHYGVELRKKDHGVLKALLEYILPKIGKEYAYYHGSDNDVAPYLDALMGSIANVAEDINKRVDQFEKFFTHPEQIKISLGWKKAFEDLEQFNAEIRRIPTQYGNQGNRKVEETMMEESNIQNQLNQATSAALHKDYEAKEKAQAPQPPKPAYTTPPWEEEKAPAVPVITNLGVPAPAPQMPETRSGTISASELLGITPGMQMPHQMMPQQGYPNPMMQMGGYPNPMAGYPNPMMQQQGYPYPGQPNPQGGWL